MNYKIQSFLLCIICVLFLSPFPVQARSIGFSLTIAPIPECQNRIDDDGDGFIDYPDDVDCEDVFGNESNTIIPESSGGGLSVVFIDSGIQGGYPDEENGIEMECSDIGELNELCHIEVTEPVTVLIDDEVGIIVDAAPEITLHENDNDNDLPIKLRVYPGQNVDNGLIVSEKSIEKTPVLSDDTYTILINSKDVPQKNFYHTYIVPYLQSFLRLLRHMFEIFRTFFPVFK